MAKGQKCPSCSPHGGAVFRMGFGWRETADNYAMTCQNCGYQRKPRAPSKKSLLHTYDFVTKEAESDAGMTTANAIRFHCFNPNGAYAKLKAMHARIDAWVDAHPERPNGVLFVHGSLNDYPRKRLFAVLDLYRAGKAHKYPLWSAVEHIEREIDRGDEFIANPDLWPKTKEQLHAEATSK